MAVLPLDAPVEVELIAEVGVGGRGVRIQLDAFGSRLASRLDDLAAGRIAPASPRDAATVMVLRARAAARASRC